MIQSGNNPIRSFSDLGMPPELPLTYRNYGNILGELSALGQAPRSFNLILDDDTIAVYDRLAETAGEIGDIVGRSYVAYRQKGLVLPERTEYGSLDKPGLELEDEGAVPARLLGYLAFKKLGDDAEFSGSVLMVDPKNVRLEAECSLTPGARKALRHEMWQFASELGLGSLWSHFEGLKLQDRIHVSDTVGQRLGKTIADSIKQVRMSVQT